MVLPHEFGLMKSTGLSLSLSLSLRLEPSGQQKIGQPVSPDEQTKNTIARNLMKRLTILIEAVTDQWVIQFNVVKWIFQDR